MGVQSVEQVELTQLQRKERWEGVRRGWYRFRRNASAVVGLAIVSAIILTAVFAEWLAPYPDQVGAFVDFRARHLAPSLSHLMGTDEVGRDIFTRVLFGYRISLMLAVVVLTIGVPIGVVLGLLAGYLGGRWEAVIMRLTDIFLALPPLAMALAITAALTPNIVNAMLAISSLWWTWYARLVHGIVRSLRNEDYIEAARRMGASTPHILFRELLPNCVSAIIVKITLDAGFVILLGAGLSFLGLGVQPPTPDLGTMVSNGANYLPDMWWEPIFPGFAILVVVLGFNLLGDGLRDLFDVEVDT